MQYKKKKLYKGYMIQDFFLIHQATSFVLPLGVLFWSLSWWWQYASRNPEEHQTINYRFTPTEQTPEIQMKARYELQNGRHLLGRRNIKEVIYKKNFLGGITELYWKVNHESYTTPTLYQNHFHVLLLNIMAKQEVVVWDFQTLGHGRNGLSGSITR